MFVRVYKTTIAVAASVLLIVSGMALVGNPAQAAASKNACQNANANANVECIFPVTQTLTGTENQAITATSSFTLTNKYTGPFTYSISPALPAGLTLDTTTGVISGTPTASAASAEYTITLTDSSSPAKTGDAYITIEIGAASGGGQGNTPDRKVTICHRTHSTTNPYVRITVDYNSVNKTKGHSGHDEVFQGHHVYDSTVTYKGKDKLWGDIIPADASGQNRWQPLNWTTLGEEIYNGTKPGCPAYNAAAYYNALRESGVPAKDIKAEIAELENEQEEADPQISKTNTNNLNYTGSNSKVAAQENDKVTICHRTNSTTNPYRKITVSASSILGKKGHYSHDEIYDGHHVFDSTVTYPNNKKDWGDIIPADPSGQNRWEPLNWTSLGQQIYSGAVAGCAEQTTQEYYNTLREAGVKKKDIKADIEEQGNIDDDPTEVDGITYTGTDPEVQNKEPKTPELPAGKTVPDQSLSGIVWLDLNKDGLKDPDEPFMPDITLSVVQVANPAPTGLERNLRSASVIKPMTVTTTVKTDANGFYIFPSIGAGNWKVVTGVPQDLGVTYDSQGSSEGEVITTVPVASSAFTWVGLVGDTVIATNKTYEQILLTYPSAVPLSELPSWLQKKVLAVLNENGLANTGTNPVGFLILGALLSVGGFLLFKRKPDEEQSSLAN